MATKDAGRGAFPGSAEKRGGRKARAGALDTGANPRAEKLTELMEFWRELDWEADVSRIQIRGERVMLMPEEACQTSGLRILRSGLLLGECKKIDSSPVRRWPWL